MTRLHGHELHVAYDGPEDGAPVLLLHSSGLGGRQWGPYAASLASAGYRVVTPDLIGYGKSEAWRGAGPFHFHADLRAMEELARSFERPFALVGHSYGGLLALQLAAAQPPGRVRALVTYEPVAWGVAYAAGDDAALQKFVDDGFLDDAAGGSAAWMGQFVDFWNGAGAWDALGEGARAQMLKAGRKTFEEVVSLCFEWTPASHYTTVACPALVLHGDQSPAIEQSVCRLLAEAMPCAERRVIEGAGHFGIVRRAAELAPLLTEWLVAR
jgi:pimeloyl-ACP methyl ester carboxylesterase